MKKASDADKEGRSPPKFTDQHWLLVGSGIILAGFVAGVLLFLLTLAPAINQPLLGLALLGICVLLGVLLGGNFLSNEMDLTTGEVRRAIALAVIAVFFGMLAFGGYLQETGQAAENAILRAALENFWWVVAAVVGFYFGGRSLERFREIKLGPLNAVTDLAGDLVDRASSLLREGNVEEAERLIVFVRELAETGNQKSSSRELDRIKGKARGLL